MKSETTKARSASTGAVGTPGIQTPGPKAEVVRTHKFLERLKNGKLEELGKVSISNLDLSGLDPSQRMKVRREVANSNERRRMMNINSGFEELKRNVPSLAGSKASKAAILQQTAEYLEELHRTTALLRQENAALRKRCGMKKSEHQEFTPAAATATTFETTKEAVTRPAKKRKSASMSEVPELVKLSESVPSSQLLASFGLVKSEEYLPSLSSLVDAEASASVSEGVQDVGRATGLEGVANVPSVSDQSPSPTPSAAFGSSLRISSAAPVGMLSSPTEDMAHIDSISTAGDEGNDLFFRDAEDVLSGDLAGFDSAAPLGDPSDDDVAPIVNDFLNINDDDEDDSAVALPLPPTDFDMVAAAAVATTEARTENAAADDMMLNLGSPAGSLSEAPTVPTTVAPSPTAADCEGAAASLTSSAPTSAPSTPSPSYAFQVNGVEVEDMQSQLTLSSHNIPSATYLFDATSEAAAAPMDVSPAAALADAGDDDKVDLEAMKDKAAENGRSKRSCKSRFQRCDGDPLAAMAM